MVTELGRILRIRLQILLDVITGNFLKCVVLRSSRCVQHRQRQQEPGCDDDFHPTSAGRAAMKNRLRGDFVWGKLLRLQVSATLIETRHNDENDSRREHQNREERKVL